MKKVVFVSVSQPSINPRMLKEANTLAEAGFDVKVIYAYWNNWAWQADKLIIQNALWTPVFVGGSPYQNKLRYIFTRVREKLTIFIVKNITCKFNILEMSRCRAYPELLKKALSIKADIYIGHIQATLPIVVKAARKYNAKCGFDAEDFHRQEVDDDTGSFYFKNIKFSEDKYLGELHYMTASSPEIASAYTTYYPHLKPVTLLNVFKKSIGLKPRKINADGPVRLFWFSQTIGAQRGLEDVAAALKALNSQNFELHLLGYIDPKDKVAFAENVLLNLGKVFFYGPIPPDEIVGFASRFDIGLAPEQGKPLNRDLCLTNKLFTYLQAGLAVIASNTKAQQCFFSENRGVGSVYQKNNPQSLIDILSAYDADRELLFNHCKSASKLGQEKYNWENESVKFLSLVNHTLGVE